MEFSAETPSGPLRLGLTRVGDGLLVRLEAADESWNSTYTPVSLASFLVAFAGLTEAEADAISERVLAEWKASPDSRVPITRNEVPRAALAAVPALVLLALSVGAFGLIVYIVVRMTIAATA